MDTFKRKPNIQCLICDVWIYRRPCELQKNQGNAFCSQKCYGIYCRHETPCVVCGTLILGSKHKKTCSKACANKNRKGIFYGDGRPKSQSVKLRQLRLRLIDELNGQCEKCGHDNIRVLQVHHKIHRKDGGTDDRDNLELLCPNCHTAEHLGFEKLERAEVGSSIGFENRSNPNGLIVRCYHVPPISFMVDVV